MDIIDITIGIGIIFGLMLLWLNILATLAVKYDHSLKKVQATAQLVIIWIIPFLGAGIVLHFFYEHSPKTIPKYLIPWPFKKLIYGKPIRTNPFTTSDDHDPKRFR